MDTKTCKTCGVIKPIGEFQKSPRMKDGHDNKCKPCRKIVADAYLASDAGKAKRQANRQKNRTSLLASAAKYRLSDKGKASDARERKTPAYKERMKRYYIAHRGSEEINARSAVGGAIRRGKIPAAKTLLCACGKQAQHYHHHQGYSREHRFHVIPVCAACHKKADLA